MDHVRLRSRASPGPPLGMIRPQTSACYMCARCFRMAVPGHPETLGTHMQPQTSQDCSKLQSFHSSKLQHVCARACARARKHARLPYLLNVLDSALAVSIPLSRNRNSSLLIFVLTTRFLTCPAVTRVSAPLRGALTLARLDKIVA